MMMAPAMGPSDIEYLSPERIGFVLVVELWCHGLIFPGKEGNAGRFFAQALPKPDCLPLDKLLALTEGATRERIIEQWSKLMANVDVLFEEMDPASFVGYPSLREERGLMRPISKKTVLGKLLLETEGCIKRLDMNGLVDVHSNFCRAAHKIGLDTPSGPDAEMAALFGPALDALQETTDALFEERPILSPVGRLHRKHDLREVDYAQGLLDVAEMHYRHGNFAGATEAATAGATIARDQSETSALTEILGLFLTMFTEDGVEIPSTVGSLPQILKYLQDHPDFDTAAHIVALHNALAPGSDPSAALAAMDIKKAGTSFDQSAYHLVHFSVWIRFGRGLLASAHLSAMRKLAERSTGDQNELKLQVAVILGTWFDESDQALEILSSYPQYTTWRVLFQAANKLKAFQPLAASEMIRAASDVSMQHMNNQQTFYYRMIELEILLQQRRHAAAHALALGYANKEKDTFLQLSYELQACRSLLMRGSSAMEAEATSSDILTRANAAHYLPLVVEASIILAHSLMLQDKADAAISKLEPVLGVAEMCQLPRQLTEVAVVYASITKNDDITLLAASNQFVVAEGDRGTSRIALAAESLRRIHAREDVLISPHISGEWSFDEAEDDSVTAEELVPLHVEVCRLALVAPPVEGRKRRNSKDMRSPHKRTK